MAGINNVGRLVAIAFVSGILAWFAAGTTAFAQAGSTGGSVGKQDKSISGGEAAPSQNPPASKKPLERTDEQTHNSSAASLAGSWNWTAQCALNAPSGVFVISQVSGTQFSGSFLGDYPGSLSGKIAGDRIFFTRQIQSPDHT
jgi:hypothetical protein